MPFWCVLSFDSLKTSQHGKRNNIFCQLGKNHHIPVFCEDCVYNTCILLLLINPVSRGLSGNGLM